MSDWRSIHLPDPGQNKNLISVLRNRDIQAWENDIFSVFWLANSYLWFAFWVIAMFVIVYAGVKLVTARGKPDEMKKLWKTLMSIVVGLLIAVFSVLAINLLVNLF